jgi:hypothetical protein
MLGTFAWVLNGPEWLRYVMPPHTKRQLIRVQLEKQRNQADAAAIEARATAGKAKEEVKKAQDEAKQASLVSTSTKGTSSTRELEFQKENAKVMVRLIFLDSLR